MNARPASSAQPVLDPSAAGAPVADGAPAVDRASACDAGEAGGPRAAAAAPDAAQGSLVPCSVELLAPAGSMAALHAAVSAGADAVYLGMEAFNARRGADNFTPETLAEACAYAHLRGARVYVTMNVAVLPEEVRAALDAARQAYRAGVDAFIVQDIGLAAALREALPAVRLHISTQMNTHNVAGIEAAARLGASRVTLARELSLGEIELLAREAADRGMEVETFAHGALCVCYSGQCFMSSLIGGRSANRGMCAQACRLPYELRAGAEGEALPAPGEHLLSPRDLCSIDLLPELVRAGAASLKLEGRMKSPDYVHAVTSVYRAVLDRVLAAAASPQRAADRDALRATDEERRVLAEAFSRGFTTAYLEGERGNDIMSYGRPNNRGVLVGRVASVRDGKAAISAQRELACGDVLEFWTKRGHFAYTLDEVRLDRAGNVVTEPDRPVGKGDRVFRVRSAADAFADDAMEPRIAVAGRVRMRLGEPLRMEFCVADDERRRARDGRALEAVGVAEGPEMEPARTKAVAAEDVRAHVDRLGTSPYRLESLDIDLDEGVGVGFSLVHRIRAAALEDLTRQLTEPWSDREDGAPRIRPSASRGKAARPAPARECLVVALATNPACARVAKRAGADAVYVPALEYKRGGALAAGLRTDETDQAGYPKQCVVALPAVEHEACGRSREALVGGSDVWERVAPGRPVLADSLGALVRAARGIENLAFPHDFEFESAYDFYRAFDDIFEMIPYNACWNKIFLRSALLDGNIIFPEDIAIGEDATFFTLYMPSVKSVKVLKDIYYIYHLDESNPLRFHHDANMVLRQGLERIDFEEAVLQSLGCASTRYLAGEHIRLLYAVFSCCYSVSKAFPNPLHHYLMEARKLASRCKQLDDIHSKDLGFELCAMRVMCRFPILEYVYLGYLSRHKD